MKNVLITGGSSGIGLAIAERLIESGGYRVISLSRNPDKIQRALRSHPHLEGKIDFVTGDVGLEDDCINLLDYLQVHYQELHGLVNNAGYLTKGTTETISLKQWEQTMEVNLSGPFRLTKTLLPLLKKAGNASVVNISSIAAVRPGTSVAYSVSKAGLDMLTLFLAGDLGPYGIRVNSINPGLVRTNLHRDNNIFTDEESYEEMVENARQRYPLGRIGEPQDIAEAAAFLISEKASWITGAILMADGGTNIFNDLIPPKK
jgi:NAD(P)-dependent dehydrogenase (short-subunit alcohol dehydrogenase family)